MSRRIRRINVVHLHRWLSMPLLDLGEELDLSSWWAYALEYGIIHALSIPEKRLAYQTIEGWIYHSSPTMKRKALKGLLLLLQYSKTVDEAMAILSRTDHEIRAFLSDVVPEPIVRSAQKCATIGQKDLSSIGQADMMELILFFGDFDNLITYLLVVQCADLLCKGQEFDSFDSMFSRATLGGKVRSIIQVRQIQYTATMPTLQKLPDQIFHDLQQSAELLVSLRNQLMHGALDLTDTEVYRQIYRMAWDFKLLFFCLCECQTELQTHQTVILNDIAYQVCTSNLVYKGQTVPLWPFYLVLCTDEQQHWFIHNIAKEGQSTYLEIHTNDKVRPLKGRLRLQYPEANGLSSLRNVPVSEVKLIV